MEVLYRKTKQIQIESITVAFDNKKLGKNLQNKIRNPNTYTLSRGIETSRIKEILNKIKIEVKLE